MSYEKKKEIKIFNFLKHIVGKEGMHGLVTANYKYQILKKRKKNKNWYKIYHMTISHINK